MSGCVELAPELPQTHQICVMDREADFFELFCEQRKTGKVDLLVRAKHDRTIDEGICIFLSQSGPARSAPKW